MRSRGKKTLLAAIGAAILVLGISAPMAQAAASDPIFVFFPPKSTDVPTPPANLVPPPGTGFEGPCGLVTAGSTLYVSDYYHHVVDLFNLSTPLSYQRQLAKEDPLDGPCGLALDSSERLFVNNYHRNVVRYAASLSLGSGVVIDEADPTGVAVDPATDDVYVDDRTYVAVYDSSGAPVLDGLNPLKIGLGDLEDGYGLAFAAGRVYVADAASDTVKVYEAGVGAPVLEISGPGLGFTSLRDSAVAVDAGSGKIYVVDDLQPGVAEEPEAAVDVFSAAGVYLGRLKYKVVDAGPPGLTASGGNVYVTSGNTSQASVYGYGPNSEIGTALPPLLGLAVVTRGAGTVSSAPTFGIDCAASCEEQIRAGAQVRLTATPEAGSGFAGWSGGGCTGTGTCTVTMDEATAVTASFGEYSSATGAVAAAPVAQAATATLGRRAGHRDQARRRHPAKHRHHPRHHRHGRQGR